MVLDYSGTLFFPFVDLLEPIVKGFSWAAESENDVDKLLIFGGIDVCVTNVDFFRDIGKLTSRGDLSGDCAEALLLLVAVKEEHGDHSGKDHRKVGQDLAEAANGHVGERLAER